MRQRPLLGDEAIALGAIHGGLSGAYSYPGTPATEIFEFIERETRNGPPVEQGGVHAVWSANEKVAMEQALGMSYSGRRAMVSFKHVGLNVAADPFMNSSITGINGGLLVVVADDPGMHSSQNEQDSRVFTSFALLPCLEPGFGQEAYQMTREAFDLSERFGIPFTMRLVTRFAHSRSTVKITEPGRPVNPLNPSEKNLDWVLLPAVARRRYKHLIQLQEELTRWSESCQWNRLHIPEDLSASGKKLGVIACGVGSNYLMENLSREGMTLPWLKVGAYPLPVSLIRRLAETVEQVLVLEDGYPHVESSLYGLMGPPGGKRVIGRLTGHLPRTGELNPDLVRTALGLPPLKHQTLSHALEEGGTDPVQLTLPVRPPSLCKGCPHTDTYNVIREILDETPEARVFGDIGCYTLSALPPLQTIHSCVDMGASISMAMGAAQSGMDPVLATIGDSTFIHSGMTSLIDAARQDLNMTVFILDNSTVAMTGGQPPIVDGDRLLQIVRGLGVDPDHIHVVNAHPREHRANLEIFKQAVAHRGLSVVIPTRECIQTLKKSRKKSKQKSNHE